MAEVVSFDEAVIMPNDEYDDFRESFENLELSEKSIQDKLADFQLLLKNSRVDDDAIKIKERCIYRLAQAYSESKQHSQILSLLKDNTFFFSQLPKARTAKIVRNILAIVAQDPESAAVQIQLCNDIAEWCKAEKRTFLRQRIESKLAALLLQVKQPIRALEVVDALLAELRKLDDKQMLTEVHLTESRVYHALQNLPKAKASLTASRTAANSIYVAPLLQAELDEMTGTLLCEEGDYTTAYSYFLEAFDAYDQANLAKSAVACLKYMVLCKVLKEAAQEVSSLLSSKISLKHAGADLKAMAAVARAAKEYSLEDFQQTLQNFESELKGDDLIAHHLDLLYDKMLESNLLKIIHPYSVVEITFVANQIKLREEVVVQKLSQMILDRKLLGILDQGKGHLIVYDDSVVDANYSKGTEIITNLGEVVEALSQSAKVLRKKTA